MLARLPSGRHRLTREVVAASQHGRLIEAMVHAVADKGYGPTTVADVVERAAVSRKTFYEHFGDKEACFLAAYDVGVEYVLGRLGEAAEPLRDAGWRERVRSDIETYLTCWGASPAFAWSLHVEVSVPGRTRSRVAPRSSASSRSGRG